MLIWIKKIFFSPNRQEKEKIELGIWDSIVGERVACIHSRERGRDGKSHGRGDPSSSLLPEGGDYIGGFGRLPVMADHGGGDRLKNFMRIRLMMMLAGAISVGGDGYWYGDGGGMVMDGGEGEDDDDCDGGVTMMMNSSSIWMRR